MTEVKEPHIPKPPQEADPSRRIKSPYASGNADDKVKGRFGLTQKERFGMALGWLKAHDEVNPVGYEIKTPGPFRSKGGFRRVMDAVVGMMKGKNEDKNPFDTQTKVRKEKKKPPSDQWRREALQKAVNLKEHTRENWSELLKPLAASIAVARTEKEGVVLKREDKMILGVFLNEVRRKKLEENPDLEYLVKTG